ncbi:MAG: DUF4062 domain-containing protein [Pirellulales bacterium]|nr:DUF4062 domain-containing protein [Pirellulales bacterium]
MANKGVHYPACDPLRVFVSSTTRDLRDHRRAVIRAIIRSGHVPVCMEHEAAKDAGPLEEVLRLVRSCDAYVGILARTYGSIAAGRGCSFTECEYLEAVERRIRCFGFLLDESVEWPPEYCDEPSSPIWRLRSRLGDTKWVSRFTTPDSLAAEVAESLCKFVSESLFERIRHPSAAEKERSRAEVKVLKRRGKRLGAHPRSPEPVVGLNTAVTRHFQDREDELKELRRCLDDRNIRLVLICGRGGIGKTQLVKKLLNEIPIAADARPGAFDGVVFVNLGESECRSPKRIVEYICDTMDPYMASEVRDVWCRKELPVAERIALVFRRGLARHRCLIVLDNLESILDRDNRIPDEYAGLRQFVEACLQQDHAALIIATSRRALTLSSHIEMESIGRKQEIPLEHGLPPDAAVALLRKLDPKGENGIRDCPESALADVARRCQCIPRTLIALAATLASRPASNLPDLLADEPLFAGFVEDPSRELYLSLQAEERMVVQVLAVFQQYEQAVPAAAIGYVLPALPVNDIMNRLVRNHVVNFQAGRFSLHPLDLHYAYEQLPD